MKVPTEEEGEPVGRGGLDTGGDTQVGITHPIYLSIYRYRYRYGYRQNGCIPFPRESRWGGVGQIQVGTHR